MSWNNAEDIVVAGTGQVYIADVGTALPTQPDSVLSPATWTGLGYHNEDGVAFSATPSVEDIMGWQSRQPLRRILTAQEIVLSFALLQWDENSVPLAFGGGSITDLGSGEYRYDFPSDTDPLDEKAIVVDCIDGDTIFRFAFERGSVTEAVESSFTKSAAAELPISFKVLGAASGGSPGRILTNAPGFAVGS